MTGSAKRTALLCLALGAIAALGWGQGYSPDEAVKHMTVPDGLRAKLVACEPMIVQPVSMEFDDRGRMWIVQYLQYPNPAGLKRVTVDRYSRTTYDRIPDPPPRGPKGADGITILEDDDGDGRADRAHDFVNGLSLASGLAFGHGGVFVIQPPYLLFYPDRDRDDVPDGDPEVLLTGFGMEDAHAVANSLLWGPDGWLYGVEGSTVTSNIRGHLFQQGIWRYHPLTKEFELFAEGGGNMWGLDYDEHGNLFASTNFGPYVMLHGVQGGYYWKSFGKHGELHNPYAYGYFDHMTQHDPQGGHVTDGGIVYQGDSLPAPFRGKYIAANLLSHTVYWHRIQPTGSTFESFHEGVLLDSHDNWFAPSDVTTGPDGAVYVADWNDKRTAHPDPDADWDRSNGRVYKIEAEGTKRVPPFDLSKLSSGELVNLLDHPNAWFRRRARVLLAERRDREVIPHLQKRISKKKSGPAALETLWALHVGGGFDKKTANALLKSADADLRRWAVRLIGEEKSLGESLGKDLTALAKTEKEVTVRSQLAQTAQRIPPREGLALAGELLKRDEDARDPHLPLLLWWAIEPRAMTETDSLLKRFCEPSAWKKTMIRETIIPRLVRRYATEGSPAADEACLRLIASAPATEERRKLTAALDQGLNDRSRTTEEKPPGNLYEQYAVAKEAVPETNSGTKSEAKPPSARLKEAIFKLWESDAGDSVAMSLSARLGYAPAIERAKQIAADPNAAAGDRAAMIGIIGQSGRADAVPLLLGLFSRDASAPVRMAALDAARRFPDDTVAAALIAAYAGADADMQSHIRDALFSREEWSREFLAAVDAGTLSAPDIPMTQLRRIALHGDADLNALVTKHWGAVREGTPEEKLADMRRLNNDLRAAPGNPAKGKETFTRLCAVCHQLFGEGNKVGPDLTQSNRMDTDFLLVSLVDPSFTIRKEYMPFIVETKDGRVLNGLIVDRTPGAVTLVDAKNEKTVINMSEVKELRESSVSIMPEDLLKEMKPEEFRDLFSFLQSASGKP